jgi:DNA-binding GntR family transcriptional regulator
MTASIASSSAEVVAVRNVVKEPTTPVAQLAPAQHKSQADRVADAIIEQCIFGSFQPGQRLKESELAKQFNVSRVPIREALMELASQGVVYYSPRRGARLMHVDRLKLRKVLEVRERLETLALRTAVQMFRSEPAALNPLNEAVIAMRDASRAHDVLGAAKADVAFHRGLCVASGNEALIKAWSAVSRQFLIFVAMDNRQRQTRLPHAEIHQTLLNTLVEADYAEAERALSEHILQEWWISD